MKNGTDAVFVVSSLDDLARLRCSRSRRVQIRLLLPSADDDRRLTLETRASNYLVACGCNEGALAGLLYAITVVTLIISGLIAAPSLLGWGVVIAGLVGSLVVGKLIGLAVARIKFLCVLGEIEHLVLAEMKGLH